MEGFRGAGKDVWRGEEEQGRVRGQLPFQVLKERGEMFGMRMDRYTCQYRAVSGLFDLVQGGGREVIPKFETKSGGESSSHLCVHTVKKRSSLCCSTCLPLDNRDSNVP